METILFSLGFLLGGLLVGFTFFTAFFETPEFFAKFILWKKEYWIEIFKKENNI